MELGGEILINQALEVFKKEYEKKGEKLILDSYIPADGTYIIVKPVEDNFKIDAIINIKQDKVTRSIDRTKPYMNFICEADYNSKINDMNKAILPSGGKVIQGNNYLSFIIKKESLTNGKLTDEIIDDYYRVLEDPLSKYKKPNARELYKSIEKEIGEVDRNRLEKIKRWIKENLFQILEDNSGKDYFKIFFYYPEDFEKEGKRYFIPNIYNNNDFNQVINKEIYGLSNDNMGLNAKKPYLENKTRKAKVPYLVSQSEIMLQKKFFDYLMNQAILGLTNIYIDDKIMALKSIDTPKEDFSGIYFRIKKGKEVEILDFDIIPCYKANLIRSFRYRNVLEGDNELLKQSFNEIGTLEKLHKLINEVLFSKFLMGNYFTEAKDMEINDEALKNSILMSRNALFNWFYKGNDKNIWGILDKVTLMLVKGSITKGYRITAINKFNLRVSLKDYFQMGGESMADKIIELKDDLRNKISRKDTDSIKGDLEYCFAVGQLVSFLLSKSRGKKIPLSLANSFINAKSDRIIKEKLRALYNKYNYDIYNYGFKFRNLYAMVASYEIEGKIDEDMIIAGYLHSNLIYEKSNEDINDLSDDEEVKNNA